MRRRQDLKPYVLTWHETIHGNDLLLHGPFTTAAQATEYGRAWQTANADDPSWQVVMLHVPPVYTIRLN